MSTRARVLRMLEENLAQAEIARRLGVTKSTVAYHARRVVPPDPRFRRRYDWREVQRFYDAGNTITDCQQRFGFSRETWHSARRRGVLTTRPAAMPLEELLVVGRSTNRRHLVMRLVSAGLKDRSCETCGLSHWQGAPLVVQLHHVNGDGVDNRLENLQLLCPNCHSQTDNWGGRNVKRRLTSLSGGEEATMETQDDRQDQPDESQADDGPAPEDLESDPAYNPQDEELKDLKGG